ncbi:DUF6479 family protein [Streptomyces sp. NPDC088725]|uniref:DUF6479 family protein n=1 Tax=Streptomyces sp. NPDC088725 TaxID=3365873 RepID=UPI00380334BF
MNPPNMLNGAAGAVLAADTAGSLALILVVGLIVVALLIGGFIIGMRRRDKEPPPPLPSEQPHRPAHPTHIEENVEPSDMFPTGGERFTPHELGGHGDEAFGHEDERSRRSQNGGRNVGERGDGLRGGLRDERRGESPGGGPPGDGPVRG